MAVFQTAILLFCQVLLASCQEALLHCHRHKPHWFFRYLLNFNARLYSYLLHLDCLLSRHIILLHIKIKTLVKVRNGFKSVLCDNLEGWDGVGGEKEVQEGGDICMSMADS